MVLSKSYKQNVEKPQLSYLCKNPRGAGMMLAIYQLRKYPLNLNRVMPAKGR